MFQEGDVFRIVVPLDEKYSFDYGMHEGSEHKNMVAEENGETGVKTDEKTSVKTNEKTGVKTSVKTDVKTDLRLTQTEQGILKLVKENPAITQKELAECLGLSNSGIRYARKGLKDKNLLTRTGSRRSGGWKVNEE